MQCSWYGFKLLYIIVLIYHKFCQPVSSMIRPKILWRRISNLQPASSSPNTPFQKSHRPTWTLLSNDLKIDMSTMRLLHLWLASRTAESSTISCSCKRMTGRFGESNVMYVVFPLAHSSPLTVCISPGKNMISSTG